MIAEDGRVLDHLRAQRYVATQRLQADRDLGGQEDAAERIGLSKGYSGGAAELSNCWRILNVVARWPDMGRLSDLCLSKTILIAPHAQLDIDGDCRFFYGDQLRIAGALAIWPQGDQVEIVTAARRAGWRLWTGYRPVGGQ